MMNLREHLHAIDLDPVEEDNIMTSIVEAITYDRTAEFELSYSANVFWPAKIHGYESEFDDASLFDQNPEQQYQDKVNRHFIDMVSMAMVDLGICIYQQLRQLGCYINGALDYKYSGFAGQDMILFSNNKYINTVQIPRNVM